MRPLLFVGLGGAGGKTLRALKQNLNLKLKDIGYLGEIPSAWQFLHIDVQLDGVDFPAPPLDAEEFCQLVRAGSSYDSILSSIESKFSDKSEQGRFLAGWAQHRQSNPFGPPTNRRGVGRVVGLAEANQISKRVQHSISKLTSPAANQELIELSQFLFGTEHYQVLGRDAQVIFVSSLVGGTGSAILIDVAEIVKRSSIDTWTNRPIAFLYTANVFEGFEKDADFGLVGLATISELLSASLRPLGPEMRSYFAREGIKDLDVYSTCGPQFNYLIGAENMTGTRFAPDEVIKNTAGILATAALNPKLAEPLFDIIPVNIGLRSSGLEQLQVPHQCATYSLLGEVTVEWPENSSDGDSNKESDIGEFMQKAALSSRGHLPFAFSSITHPPSSVFEKFKEDTVKSAKLSSARARTLKETIPLDDASFVTVICGWLVASMFKLLRSDGNSANARLLLLNPVTKKYCQFPSPMYHHSKSDAISRLPSVLESLSLALTNFGESGERSHMEAYQVLKHLGSEILQSIPAQGDSMEADLIGEFILSTLNDHSFKLLGTWIEDGTMDPAIEFDASKLFETENFESIEARKQAVSSYLDRSIKNHSDYWESCETTPWASRPEMWEIKDEIMESLEMLKKYVSIFPIDRTITSDR